MRLLARPIPLIVLFTFILAEALWYRLYRHEPYPWKESTASLGVAIGHGISPLFSPLIWLGLGRAFHEHRLFTFAGNEAWTCALLFVCTEFFYYWYHRFSHECRWMWASHSVHHSANHFTLSTAYRLAWFPWLSGTWIFFLPLVWIGFDPLAVGIMMSINLAYQFFLHTEAVPKLGALELILNTPSHHRVHHASNPRYLDRNYGGVTVVFDRLFGTLAVEDPAEPCRYGLVKPVTTLNPFAIATHEWRAILYDLHRARGWREFVVFAFGAPSSCPSSEASELAHPSLTVQNGGDALCRHG